MSDAYEPSIDWRKLLGEDFAQQLIDETHRDMDERKASGRRLLDKAPHPHQNSLKALTKRLQNSQHFVDRRT